MTMREPWQSRDRTWAEWLLAARFNAGVLLQTRIEVHWTMPLTVGAFLLWTVTRPGVSPWLALSVALVFSVVLAITVLAHELGHVLAARRCGLPANEVLLHPLGGLAMIGQATRTPRQEFFVAAGGPFVHPLFASVLLPAYLMLGGSAHWGLLWPLADDFALLDFYLSSNFVLYLLHLALTIQASLFWFNVLLPAYPMDGGRMLFALLWQTSNQVGRALYDSLRVSQVFSVLLIATGLWCHHLLVTGIGVMVLISATRMLRQAPYADEPRSWETLPPEPWLQAHQEQPPRRLRSPGPLRRWLMRRQARALVAREEQRSAMEVRLDLLLDKIAREGRASLTREETRFLDRASRAKRAEIEQASSRR
jgi:Zn-dependent protease